MSGPTRMTFEFSDSEFELIELAARRLDSSPEEFVRHAALRMARQGAPGQRCEDSNRPGVASPFPSRRSARREIHPATFPTVEIVRQLKKHLGLQLLAITVGTKPDDVKRWASEESEPSPVHERRLREAHGAWQLVVSAESPETSRAWWMGMKDSLDDLSPAEAIALDRAPDVMAVARYFVEAG